MKVDDRVEIRRSSPGCTAGDRGRLICKDDEFEEVWILELDKTGRRLTLPVFDFRKLSLLEIIAEAAQ